jgi:hypothetical protein
MLFRHITITTIIIATIGIIIIIIIDTGTITTGITDE